MIGAGKKALKLCGNAARGTFVLGKDCQITIYSYKFLKKPKPYVAVGGFRPDTEPTIVSYNWKIA